MALPQKTPNKAHALTAEQLEQLESDDQYLRGTASLAILNEAVIKTGVVIPPEHVWKNHSPELARKAILSVFPLIGGMPAMALWASKNPTEYYRIFAKMAPTEQFITGGGNTLVFTQVPESPLDDICIDSTGKVVDAEYK